MAIKVNGTTVIDDSRNITTSGTVTAGTLRAGDGTDGRFYSDTAGRTAFADGNFYIQGSVGNFYNYATSMYHGSTSGDAQIFRGNTLTGNSWSLTGAGAATFSSVTASSLAGDDLILSSNDILYLHSDYSDGASTQGRVRIANATPAASTSKPSYLEIWNNNPDPTDNMLIGQVHFAAEDVNSQYKVYGLIEGQREGVQDGSIGIKVLNTGVYRTAFYAEVDTTVYARGDIFLKPYGDTVTMLGTSGTGNRQLDFQLNYNGQIVTASNDLTIVSSSGDITLRATGDNVYMQGASSNEQLNFSLGTSEQVIYASDALQLQSGGSNPITFDTFNGRIQLYDSGTQRAYFELNTAGTAKLYTGTGNGTLNSTFSGNNLTVAGTATANSFVGDGSSLTGIAAGAGGGGSDDIFWENGQNVTTNYTITNNKNAMSAGPITINSGITVTIGAGETWTVV